MKFTIEDENILRVTSIASDELEQNFVKKSLPLIVTNGVNNWKAMSTWSPEYFANKAPDKEVNLAISKDNVFSYSAKTGSILELKRTTMKQAVDLICNSKDPYKKYYVIHQSLHNDFIDFTLDYDIPAFGNKNKNYQINVWIGQANNITPLHFDNYHNFIAQVYGRKYIHLFDPSDSELLYPTYDSTPPNHTYIPDINNPDYSLFPKFKNVKHHICILNPGDVLFLPSGWWHQVQSLDISISVNFWWQTKIEECNPSHILRYQAVNLYNQNKFSKISDHIDISNYTNNIEIARYLNSKKHKWLAALFCAELIRTHINQSNLPTKDKDLISNWQNIINISKKENNELLNSATINTMIDHLEELINARILID